MKDQLIGIMSEIGKPLEAMKHPDGSTVLVSPYGGRVLGLFAPDDDQNFLWTHEALNDRASAKAFIEGEDWQNLGGDRTWLAPEVDFFLPEYPSTATYFQQRGLDPGQYQVTKDGRTIRLSNQLGMTSSRLKQTVRLALAKTVSAAANPLRYERGMEELQALPYAGYTLRTELEVLDANAEQCVGIWSLLQMPHGGELLIPTYTRTEPRIYFGQISAEDLVAEDHLVRYRMRARGEHKIGIRALATAGRVGYLVPTKGDQWSLIIRNFQVNPSGEYADVPWDDTGYLGFSTQACNVNSHLGCFSELEYHAPAIVPGSGSMRSEDVSQVWAFRGPLDKLRRVGQALLTPQI